jgi:hypothetical protein
MNSEDKRDTINASRHYKQKCTALSDMYEKSTDSDREVYSGVISRHYPTVSNLKLPRDFIG